VAEANLVVSGLLRDVTKTMICLAGGCLLFLHDARGLGVGNPHS
jgi:hypothetical protein